MILITYLVIESSFRVWVVPSVLKNVLLGASLIKQCEEGGFFGSRFIVHLPKAAERQKMSFAHRDNSVRGKTTIPLLIISKMDEPTRLLNSMREGFRSMEAFHGGKLRCQIDSVFIVCLIGLLIKLWIPMEDVWA